MNTRTIAGILVAMATSTHVSTSTRRAPQSQRLVGIDGLEVTKVSLQSLNELLIGNPASSVGLDTVPQFLRGGLVSRRTRNLVPNAEPPLHQILEVAAKLLFFPCPNKGPI